MGVTPFTIDSLLLYRFGRFHGFQGQAVAVDQGNLPGNAPESPQDGRKY